MSIENVTLSASIKSLERSDEQGKCAGTIHIASDVTEQREKWNQAIQESPNHCTGRCWRWRHARCTYLYGEGSTALGNIADVLGELQLPNLESLGLGRIIPIKGISPSIAPSGFYGKMSSLGRKGYHSGSLK